MNETKVVHAFLKGEVIFGLTDDGHLVAIDPSLNKWVFRASNQVLDTERAVMIRSVSFKAPEYIVTVPVKLSPIKRLIKWFFGLLKRS